MGELVNSIHDSFHARLEKNVYRFLDNYSEAELAFVARFIGEATKSWKRTGQRREGRRIRVLPNVFANCFLGHNYENEVKPQMDAKKYSSCWA